MCLAIPTRMDGSSSSHVRLSVFRRARYASTRRTRTVISCQFSDSRSLGVSSSDFCSRCRGARICDRGSSDVGGGIALRPPDMRPTSGACDERTASGYLQPDASLFTGPTHSNYGLPRPPLPWPVVHFLGGGIPSTDAALVCSRVWYLLNPTGPGVEGLHPCDSPLQIQNHRLDPAKPTLVLIPQAGASISLFCSQVRTSAGLRVLGLGAEPISLQFQDPRLQHVNLLAVDCRHQGRTTETSPMEGPADTYTIEVRFGLYATDSGH